LLIVLLTVGILGGGLLILAYQLHFGLGLLVESAMLATTLSQKGLKAAATAVYAPLSKDNLIAARQQLSYIVGRDTENLNEEGITRATVETVAENTTDGITAPIFWAAIGGGLGALIYRAINTCDSMVAYHNEKYENFGWASAKLDDLVNYLPARLTGYLMLQTRKRYRVRKNISFNHLKKEANKHPSPNSGWTEAATALLLGVKLGGNNYYQGVRFEANQIGKARKSLEKDDIIRAVDIMEITNLLFLFTIILGVFLYVFAQTWF
ncbi:MAG: adenosylcobinamide-phosphate synthase CbiB, partial [Atopostipes suicloacalis]|nr:adenosylcobinamide-phosphate synthase CbiB [Atopostipes suicloacalis]